MKTLKKFKESMNLAQPGHGLNAQLKSLWYDGKGDWHQAHAQVDHLTDRSSAWVHAYLHRKEGDIWNADYWYRQARQTRPTFLWQRNGTNWCYNFFDWFSNQADRCLRIE